MFADIHTPIPPKTAPNPLVISRREETYLEESQQLRDISHSHFIHGPASCFGQQITLQP